MSIIRISHLYRERRTACARHPAEASWYGWIAVTASRMVGAALSEPRPRSKNSTSAPFRQITIPPTSHSCSARSIQPNRRPPSPSNRTRCMPDASSMLQRLRRRLSIAQVAQRTGIEPTTLLLLETGLQDSAAISQDTWLRLRSVLADDQPPASPAPDLARLSTPRLSSSTPGRTHCLPDERGQALRAQPAQAAFIAGAQGFGPADGCARVLDQATKPGTRMRMRAVVGQWGKPGGRLRAVLNQATRPGARRRLRTHVRAVLDQATRPGTRMRMRAVVGQWGKPGGRLHTVLDQATKPGARRRLRTHVRAVLDQATRPGRAGGLRSWIAGLRPAGRPHHASPIAWITSRLTALRSQRALLKGQIEHWLHAAASRGTT